MCCAFLDPHGNLVRPGKPVQYRKKDRSTGSAPWAGFARSEILPWWKRQGTEEVEIDALRFAERADDTRELIWDDLPPGHALRGLLDPRSGKPLLKIITRAASPAEAARFRHDRMPLLTPAGDSA